MTVSGRCFGYGDIVVMLLDAPGQFAVLWTMDCGMGSITQTLICFGLNLES